jgi:hypothetical protein
VVGVEVEREGGKVVGVEMVSFQETVWQLVCGGVTCTFIWYRVPYMYSILYSRDSNIRLSVCYIKSRFTRTAPWPGTGTFKI